MTSPICEQDKKSGGVLFAVAATVLVLFNYLFFLKWFPVLENRVWVLALIIVGIPSAFVHTRKLGDARLVGFFLAIFTLVVVLNYFAFQTPAYDPLYLFGFLIFSMPFFYAGVLAGGHPAIVRRLLLVTALGFVAILSWTWLHGLPLRDEGGFADVLKIARSEDDQSYRAHYQLIGYGLAFGAVALISQLLADKRVFLSHLVVLISLALGLYVGARGPLMGLALTYVVVLAARRGVVTTAGLLLPLIFVVGISLSTIDFNETALLQRMSADLNAGSGYASADLERLSRINLYGFALNGWLKSPISLILGNGFGSFSLAYGSSYPSWVFSPVEGSIYPHNFVLESLYELGLIGLMPLLVAVCYPLRHLSRARSPVLGRDRLCTLILLVFLVSESLVSGSIAGNYMFYFALGLASVGSASMRVKS